MVEKAQSQVTIQYNAPRQVLELTAQEGAGIIDSTDRTELVRVLDTFDLRILKEDVSLAPHLRSQGYWESWITSWFTRWVRPGMTVLDIGANFGYYTMLFEKLVGKYGTVVAYEPNPVLVELLKDTRDKNNADFKIRDVALADYRGYTNLEIPDNYIGSASIVGDFKDKYSVREHNVRVTTLDSEVQNLTFFRHDIVKIDAEGAEELIWNGGRRLWNDVSTHTTLVIEFTPGAYSADFVNELFEWGNVTRIATTGADVPIDKYYLDQLQDWEMIVVRKR